MTHGTNEGANDRWLRQQLRQHTVPEKDAASSRRCMHSPTKNQTQLERVCDRGNQSSHTGGPRSLSKGPCKLPLQKQVLLPTEV